MTKARPVQHRNQCRFCGVSWSDSRKTTDCGGMDKFHKDKRWEESSPSPASIRR